jgi:hypothetical protein
LTLCTLLQVKKSLLSAVQFGDALYRPEKMAISGIVANLAALRRNRLSA